VAVAAQAPPQPRALINATTGRRVAIVALFSGLAAVCLGVVLLTAGDGPPAVEALSDSGQGAVNPQLAIDGSDRATIVWQRSDGSAQRIQSVRLAANGSPEAIQTISPPR